MAKMISGGKTEKVKFIEERRNKIQTLESDLKYYRIAFFISVALNLALIVYIGS